MSKLNEQQMAELLVELYRRNSGKKKGKFFLTVKQFLALRGGKTLQHKFLSNVDYFLRENGFTLINIKDEEGSIAILSIPTILKKFQKLDDDLIDELTLSPEENTQQEDEVDEW